MLYLFLSLSVADTVEVMEWTAAAVAAASSDCATLHVPLTHCHSSIRTNTCTESVIACLPDPVSTCNHGSTSINA